MRPSRAIASSLVALLAASCGGFFAAPDECTDHADAYGADPVEVVGAYRTDLSRVRAMSDAEPQLFAGTPDSAVAVVCYVDGEFDRAPAPAAGGDPYDRAVYAVVDDVVELIVMGYRDSLPVVAP